MTTNRFRCQIQGQHCEQCGSTDREDLTTGDQGYSACCNEIVVWGPDSCRNHHDSTGCVFCDDCGLEQPSERRPDLSEAHVRGCSKRGWVGSPVVIESGAHRSKPGVVVSESARQIDVLLGETGERVTVRKSSVERY